MWGGGGGVCEVRGCFLGRGVCGGIVVLGRIPFGVLLIFFRGVVFCPGLFFFRVECFFFKGGR